MTPPMTPPSESMKSYALEIVRMVKSTGPIDQYKGMTILSALGGQALYILVRDTEGSMHVAHYGVRGHIELIDTACRPEGWVMAWTHAKTIASLLEAAHIISVVHCELASIYFSWEADKWRRALVIENIKEQGARLGYDVIPMVK